MDIEEFKLLIQNIVKQSTALKDKHTSESEAPVNYACIFCQTEEEFAEFKKLTTEIGKIVKNASSGPLFQIEPLETISGKLKLLKIRNPDKTRPERGDADFTVSDYNSFKEEYLSEEGFFLIEREGFEMIELIDSDFNTRAYFSNPPLDEQLGIK